MMLGVSAEQDELRASVRRFLADRAPLTRVRELMETEDGMDQAVWEQAGAQLGLQGLAIPQDYGGAGFTFAEQAIVLEEFGAALYGGPYLASAVLAATALLASPDEGARRGLLPDIASGQTVATLAFTEDDGSWDPGATRLSAVKDGPGWRLDGHKSFVLDGGTAGLILVVAATDAGLSLFAVEGDAVVRTTLPTLDQTRKLARLEYRKEICRLMTAFVASEDSVVKFLIENKTWCGVPDQALAAAKTSHERSLKFRDAACTEGPSPKAPTLSDAIKTPDVDSATNTKADRGGTFETLTGNPLGK